MNASSLNVRILNGSAFLANDVLRCLKRLSGGEVTIGFDTEGHRIARIETQEGIDYLREAFRAKSVRIGGVALKLQFPARATEASVATLAPAPAAEPSLASPNQDASQSGEKRNRVPSSPSEAATKPPLKSTKTLHQTVQGGGPSGWVEPIIDELEDKDSGSSIDNPSSAVTDATFQQGFAQSQQSAKAAEASKQLEIMTQTGECLTTKLDDLATAFTKLTADFDISRKQVHDLKLRNDELEDQAKKSTSIWEHEKAELEAELTALQNSKGLEIESLENQTKELSSALAVVTAKRDSLLEKQLEAVRTTADIEVDTQFVPVPPVVLGVPPDAIHPILTLDDKKDASATYRKVRLTVTGMSGQKQKERIAAISSIHCIDDFLYDLMVKAVYRGYIICRVDRLRDVAHFAHKIGLQELVNQCLEYCIKFGTADWYSIGLYFFCKTVGGQKYCGQVAGLCARGLTTLFEAWEKPMFSDLCPLDMGKANLKEAGLHEIVEFANHKEFSVRHRWIILIAWVKAQQNLPEVHARGGTQGMNELAAAEILKGVWASVGKSLAEAPEPDRFFIEQVAPYLQLIPPGPGGRNRGVVAEKCARAFDRQAAAAAL